MKSNTDPGTLSELVKTTALKCGSYIREQAFHITDLTWKQEDDPVTNLDREAESLIRDAFLKEDSTITIIGEEFGVLDQNGNFALYIDPIDGTKSFTRREFKASISIAVSYKSGPIFASAVYDFMKDMLFYVGIDNDPQLLVPSLGYHQILPFTQPSYKKKFILCDDKSSYRAALSNDARVSLSHPTGSVALQMAQVAAGIYDALILPPHQKDGITDIADMIAGYHLMETSGVIILDNNLEAFDYKKPYNGLVAITRDAYDCVLRIAIAHDAYTRITGSCTEEVK